jgi:hypothetical protein
MRLSILPPDKATLIAGHRWFRLMAPPRFAVTDTSGRIGLYLRALDSPAANLWLARKEADGRSGRRIVARLVLAGGKLKTIDIAGGQP